MTLILRELSLELLHRCPLVVRLLDGGELLGGELDVSLEDKLSVLEVSLVLDDLGSGLV